MNASVTILRIAVIATDGRLAHVAKLVAAAIDTHYAAACRLFRDAWSKQKPRLLRKFHRVSFVKDLARDATFYQNDA